MPLRAEKFNQSYKCDCYQPFNYCNCARKIIASVTLVENIDDIAEVLAEVMILCNIYAARAKASVELITHYFLHFQEIVERIDSIPRKRLCKEDLMHDLSRKCSMDRMEAQIAYSIIKRAFRAFYYGTDVGGVPNILLSDKLKHTTECLWLHAAKRTAQVYAAYVGIFYACQKNLECQIKVMYKQLYERICNRSQTEDDRGCTCLKCLKRIRNEGLETVKVTTGMHNIDDPYEALYLAKRKELLKKRLTLDEIADLNRFFENMDGIEKKEIKRCSCPRLRLSQQDYIYRDIIDLINTGSSQGPFDCRWFSISKEEYEADDAEIKIKLPEEYPCPVVEEECDSECECTCDECTCKLDSDIYCGELEESKGKPNALEEPTEEGIESASEMESMRPCAFDKSITYLFSDTDIS